MSAISVKHNGIVNTKKLTLNYNYCGDEEKEFFLSVVMPYIDQLIPSTSIFKLNLISCPQELDVDTGGEPFTICQCVPETVEIIEGL